MEIKFGGKWIIVNLFDFLKFNIIYIIDFLDVIVDNNEGNLFGNFVFIFFIGVFIDIMEVLGILFEVFDLEFIKGMLVGLYFNLNDLVFIKFFFDCVVCIDSCGYFMICGIVLGKYCIFGLMDVD